MPNFKTWSQENLAQFAEEANTKLIAQNELIEILQNDLKNALQAYRFLLIEIESKK